MSATFEGIEFGGGRPVWVEALRIAPEGLHITDRYQDVGGRHCAIGLGLTKAVEAGVIQSHLNGLRRGLYWLGVDTRLEADIYEWNDEERETFAAIADLIEAHPVETLAGAR